MKALNLNGATIVQGSYWRATEMRSVEIFQVVNTETAGWGKIELQSLQTDIRSTVSVDLFDAPNGLEEVVIFATSDRHFGETINGKL